MPSFTIKGVNGSQTINNPKPSDLYHDLAVSSPGITAGTITITAKKIGSDIYEDIPDGVITLPPTNSIQFTGSVESYKFSISGLVGSGDISISDTSQRV